jgi:hypothetical protein
MIECGYTASTARLFDHVRSIVFQRTLLDRAVEDQDRHIMMPIATISLGTADQIVLLARPIAHASP